MSYPSQSNGSYGSNPPSKYRNGMYGQQPYGNGMSGQQPYSNGMDGQPSTKPTGLMSLFSGGRYKKRRSNKRLTHIKRKRSNKRLTRIKRKRSNKRKN